MTEYICYSIVTGKQQVAITIENECSISLGGATNYVSASHKGTLRLSIKKNGLGTQNVGGGGIG